MNLLVDIISYPEMCAEHGFRRSTSSTSTVAFSVSSFFSPFICWCARARVLRRPRVTRHSLFGGSILKWVKLEFRLIMHEKNRVTDSE